LAIAGSFVAKDINGKLFNRGFFVTPNGDASFADKRHLFRISGENRVFTAGTNCPVISYKAWNIRLIVCYDLRFPVWIRNKNKEYDLLLCVANWPTSRATIWKVLLQARAIENLCYVCGVNRIGTDHNGIQYQGDSVVLDFKGDTLLATEVNKASVATTTISQTQLQQFRQKFPVWQDADAFKIEEN
jgi:predicted amidohydrolase